MSDLRRQYQTVMSDHFPETINLDFGGQKLTYRKRTWVIGEGDQAVKMGLRYGENPGQECAMYELVGGNLVLGECAFLEPGHGLVSALTEADMIQFGKHPSKINLTDVDNALNILKFLMDRPCCAIMKHNNPSGVAVREVLAEAYRLARDADRIAAFGGAVVLNRPCDRETAELIAPDYFEVVAAPDYEPGAAEVLASRPNLRIMRLPRLDRLAEYRHRRFVDFKSLMDGGLILQQSPINAIQKPEDFQPAAQVLKKAGKTYRAERQPTPREYADMIFGWAVEQGVTSNSVLYVKNEVTVGIGTGEQDRVGVAKIALQKAKDKYADLLAYRKFRLSYDDLAEKIKAGEVPAREKEEIDRLTEEVQGGVKGAVMISDAFFPFPDGVRVGINAGVTAICHPGGSLNDYLSIEACNQAQPQVAMVFTGQRAFKH